MKDMRIRINQKEKEMLKKVLRIQTGKIQDILTEEEQVVAEALLERLTLKRRTRKRYM